MQQDEKLDVVLPPETGLFCKWTDEDVRVNIIVPLKLQVNCKVNTFIHSIIYYVQNYSSCNKAVTLECEINQIGEWFEGGLGAYRF